MKIVAFRDWLFSLCWFMYFCCLLLNSGNIWNPSTYEQENSKLWVTDSKWRKGLGRSSKICNQGFYKELYCFSCPEKMMIDLLIVECNYMMKVLQLNPIKNYFSKGSSEIAEESFWGTVPQEGEEVCCFSAANWEAKQGCTRTYWNCLKPCLLQ